MPSVVLIDGFTGGDWTVARHGDIVTLTVRPYRALQASVADELIAEGERLLAFMDPDVVDRRVEVAEVLAIG